MSRGKGGINMKGNTGKKKSSCGICIKRKAKRGRWTKWFQLRDWRRYIVIPSGTYKA